MKKCSIFVLVLALSGCTSVTIPNYIQDKSPYKKIYYASFDRVYASSVKVLEELGWKIEKESDPALFERGRVAGDKTQEQKLLFTEIRQFSFFLGSKYTRLNLYLKVNPDKAVEVEIRYLKVTSVLFKNIYNYKSDRFVDRIFKRIAEELNV